MSSQYPAFGGGGGGFGGFGGVNSFGPQRGLGNTGSRTASILPRAAASSAFDWSSSASLPSANPGGGGTFDFSRAGPAPGPAAPAVPLASSVFGWPGASSSMSAPAPQGAFPVFGGGAGGGGAGTTRRGAGSSRASVAAGGGGRGAGGAAGAPSLRRQSPTQPPQQPPLGGGVFGPSSSSGSGWPAFGVSPGLSTVVASPSPSSLSSLSPSPSPPPLAGPSANERELERQLTACREEYRKIRTEAESTIRALTRDLDQLRRQRSVEQGGYLTAGIDTDPYGLLLRHD
jgi:hypothetical protein